jgi:solute carrier family 25 carnitine/acylcarnitine transporter 20/29
MSTTAVIRSILKQEGPKGLYRGFGVTALRELGYGPYFLAVSLLYPSPLPRAIDPLAPHGATV